jgi:hypothetical protein
MAWKEILLISFILNRMSKHQIINLLFEGNLIYIVQKNQTFQLFTKESVSWTFIQKPKIFFFESNSNFSIIIHFSILYCFYSKFRNVNSDFGSKIRIKIEISGLFEIDQNYNRLNWERTIKDILRDLAKIEFGLLTFYLIESWFKSKHFPTNIINIIFWIFWD